MWWFVLLALAGPFWDETPPEKWSEQQLRFLFTDSPWAQGARTQTRTKWEADHQLYLATARPLRDAERELRRRSRAAADPLFEDYRSWLDANAATHIVVAVRIPRPELLSDSEESRLVERESKLIARGKDHRPVLVFAPSSQDPFLRLAFPRAVRETDKAFEIEIYVPGVAGNYRTAVFALKDLQSRGKPEF